MEISKRLQTVCALTARRSKMKGPCRSSSIEGVSIVLALDKLAHEIEKSMGNSLLKNRVVHASRGMSNLPTVLYVAIFRSGRTVSTDVSVTICVGKHGEGVVLGAMAGSVFTLSDTQTVKRSAATVRVDVSGAKANVQYEDRFYNPLELTVSEFDDRTIVEHLKKSIKLVDKFVEADVN